MPKFLVSMLVTAIIFVLPCSGLCADWDLVLLVTSDTEGQLEPVLSKIKNQDTFIDQEIGGFARLAWALERARRSYPDNTLTLSAGEDLMGPFFSLFNGGPVYTAMSRMGYDAATLGHHEFDWGEDFLAQGLTHCSFPIVLSNLSISKELPLEDLVKKWAILEKNGIKVGVFGLISKDISLISKPGPLVSVSEEYMDTAEQMVEILDAQGADIIVALAHIGPEAARELAMDVPDLDVICIGGGADIIERGRETVPHKQGKTIIVQTGQKGAYLGMLKLMVDKDIHSLGQHHWQAIYLDESIPEDPEMKAMVAEYVAQLPDQAVVAVSSVLLDSSKEALRTGEAPLGNLVCDIIRERFGADLALYNGGGIRGDRIIPAGEITTMDLEEMFPFGNELFIARISGRVLLQVLERSVSQLPEPKGNFLQVSGLRYVVDTTKAGQVLSMDGAGKATGIETPGNRVRSVEIMTEDGGYEPLDLEARYSLVTNNFLMQGGDGFFMLSGLENVTKTDMTVRTAVEEGLRERGKIAPEHEGRISFAP